MVCVTCLYVGGAPSNLRYLVGRLRRRLPGLKLLVGLWSEDDLVSNDRALRDAIGADLYVRTLRDAVQACLDAARMPEAEQAA